MGEVLFMAKEAAVPSTEQATTKNDVQLSKMGNVVVKCPKCREILYTRDWEKNLKVCSRCNYHFKLHAKERIELLVDADSFVEMDANLISSDPLHFTARNPYAPKLE